MTRFRLSAARRTDTVDDVNFIRTLIGTRRDWRLDRLRIPRLPRLSLAWVGPLAVIASTLVGWFAFTGAQGEEGNAAFGLFIGSASIVLMAWGFVLAIRLRLLEPLFGGLDRMYRVHRWAGALSVMAMYLHTSLEPELRNGIRGAAENVAEAATDLAETGELMIYALVGITLLRWLPYRFWRLTHKLLGIPFAFASWHFFTAEKTYANSDPWGLWFGGIMLAGLVAFVWRVVGRDAMARGVRYRIADMRRTATTTRLTLEPIRRKLHFESGQFAFIKVQARGMSEPHAFSIASSPNDDRLRFFVRELGDWTRKLRERDLVGTEVIVEGPYGRFRPLDPAHPGTVWVAGGVGITPFLSVIDDLEPRLHPPTLVYSVRDRATATAIEVLEEAARDGRIDLQVHASADGNRLTAEAFVGYLDSPEETHVAMCGPSGLIGDMAAVASRAGVRDVETEDFDIRQGFGPDLSVPIDDLVRR
jgi:predicted ferric reductase